MSAIPKPYARPGQMGLFCGTCGEAMMIVEFAHALLPESWKKHAAQVWNCQKCAESWSVAPVHATSAVRMTSAEKALTHG